MANLLPSNSPPPPNEVRQQAQAPTARAIRPSQGWKQSLSQGMTKLGYAQLGGGLAKEFEDPGLKSTMMEIGDEHVNMMRMRYWTREAEDFKALHGDSLNNALSKAQQQWDMETTVTTEEHPIDAARTADIQATVDNNAIVKGQMPDLERMPINQQRGFRVQNADGSLAFHAEGSMDAIKHLQQANTRFYQTTNQLLMNYMDSASEYQHNPLIAQRAQNMVNFVSQQAGFVATGQKQANEQMQAYNSTQQEHRAAAEFRHELGEKERTDAGRLSEAKGILRQNGMSDKKIGGLNNKELIDQATQVKAGAQHASLVKQAQPVQPKNSHMSAAQIADTQNHVRSIKSLPEYHGVWASGARQSVRDDVVEELKNERTDWGQMKADEQTAAIGLRMKSTDWSHEIDRRVATTATVNEMTANPAMRQKVEHVLGSAGIDTNRYRDDVLAKLYIGASGTQEEAFTSYVSGFERLRGQEKKERAGVLPNATATPGVLGQPSEPEVLSAPDGYALNPFAPSPEKVERTADSSLLGLSDNEIKVKTQRFTASDIISRIKPAQRNNPASMKSALHRRDLAEIKELVDVQSSEQTWKKANVGPVIRKVNEKIDKKMGNPVLEKWTDVQVNVARDFVTLQEAVATSNTMDHDEEGLLTLANMADGKNPYSAMAGGTASVMFWPSPRYSTTGQYKENALNLLEGLYYDEDHDYQSRGTKMAMGGVRIWKSGTEKNIITQVRKVLKKYGRLR